MVEAAIIAVLGLLALAFTQGWIMPPAINPNRRRQNEWEIPTRFSLRTVLIVTTLIAVVLGLAVWASGWGR